MSLFQRKITRTQRPSNHVGIDWENPITDGLLSCVAYNDQVLPPRDIITNMLVTNNSTAHFYSHNQRGWRYNRQNSNDGNGTHVIRSPSLSGGSVFVEVDIANAVTGGRLFQGDSGLEFRRGGQDRIYLGGTQNNFIGFPITGAGAGVIVRVLVTWTASGGMAYWTTDNRNISTLSCSVGVTAMGTNLHIGSFTNGGTQLTTVTGDVGFYNSHSWGRELSEGEASSLLRNPDQVLEKIPKTSFFEEAAPAGGRIMSSLANHGGLAGHGGIAGQGGGLAG